MEMLWEYGKAFVVGGLICLVGQILIDKTKLTPARILVLFVTLGVVLTAVGLSRPSGRFRWSGGDSTVDRLWLHDGQGCG